MNADDARHPFDRAIALEPQDHERWLGHTSPAYANMVGPYGGISAAQALQVVMQHPQRLGEPTALTVNFCAALADGPFTAIARPLRTNRSTQHWLVALQQQGETQLSATVFTALRRDTWGSDELRKPAVPAPAQCPQAPARGVAWLERYEMRFVEGALPETFDGIEQPHSTSRLWVRDDPPRPVDFPSLAALCDSFFPRIFVRRRRFAPIGTITLSSFFHADEHLLQQQGTQHLAGRAWALNFRNGYFDQSAEVWSRSGVLLASTHQMVYYRE